MNNGDIESFPQKVTTCIEQDNLFISPIVILELEYLYERGKVLETSQDIIKNLKTLADLEICPEPFLNIIQEALEIKWTRDSFDRLIVAHAQAKKAILLTKDQTILKNYKKAVWD